MAKPAHTDMRGLLGFLLLGLIGSRPSSGQDLAEEIGKRKGVRPNPGTIYPALKSLRGKGLIKGDRKGKQIVYTLTPKGKLELRDARDYFNKVFMGL